METFNISDLVKILENFRKKHPGRLKLILELNRRTWVEEISKFEAKDKYWKEPSVTARHGSVFKLSDVYSRIFIEDYYEEPCMVIRYDQSNPDDFRYLLNVPLQVSRELHKGDVIAAYLPDIKPHLCNMAPHHILLGSTEEMEEIYSEIDSNKILTCFSQGLRFIANRFIYPSGHISDLDPDDMYGYVFTLIIL